MHEQTGTIASSAGETFYILGVAVALIMWSFALIWLFLAIATILSASRFSFNMGWWGFVFPLAVFTLATLTLGVELDSRFFNVLGTVRSILSFLSKASCALQYLLFQFFSFQTKDC
jgi:tellurite resistance protein TehA-like permease